MSENEMGYRGSKSILIYESINTVKEQRANGSYFGLNKSKLRCALMDCESSYQVKIPSKQLNKKYYSTLNTAQTTVINPWFWTGLIDAEGSFTVMIDKNQIRKIGWRVQSKFQMGLHLRDLELLLKLQRYFEGIGSIHIDRNRCIFSIDSNKDLKYLINHF